MATLLFVDWLPTGQWFRRESQCLWSWIAIYSVNAPNIALSWMTQPLAMLKPLAKL